MADSDPKPDQNSVQPPDNQIQDEPRKPDAAEGADPVQPSDQRPDASELTPEISPDNQDAVHEFMAEAAQQNEAANEAVAEGAGGDTPTSAGAPANGDSTPAPYIAFEHIYKSFGDTDVLKDVSFSILPGETLCILGRSGVGKSVSLQMLMGFYKPDKGRIMVAGEDICGYTEKQKDFERTEGEIRGEQEDRAAMWVTYDHEAHDARGWTPDQIQATVAQRHLVFPVNRAGG